MYIALKYGLKRKAVNNQLQSLGNAIMCQWQTAYYFTNPIVAYRVKQYLSKKVTNFKYELEPISKKDIVNKTLIKTYDNFIKFAKQKNDSKVSDTQSELEK